MKLIVGLGNPGEQYKNNRHNVGFQVVDAFALHHKIKFNKEKFNGVFYKGEDFIVAKPLTYMNLSGDFVQAISAFYKIAIEDILIIYDDTSFESGKAIMKPKGSSGGQNGIKDIIDKMGTNEIQRIKVGIGRPHAGIVLADYVLGNFSKEEIAKNEKIMSTILKAINDFITKGYKIAENNFNAAF